MWAFHSYLILWFWAHLLSTKHKILLLKTSSFFFFFFRVLLALFFKVRGRRIYDQSQARSIAQKKKIYSWKLFSIRNAYVILNMFISIVVTIDTERGGYTAIVFYFRSVRFCLGSLGESLQYHDYSLLWVSVIQSANTSSGDKLILSKCRGVFTVSN